MVDEVNIFEDRRKNDPQGVIDALIKQTTKQGKEINRLLKVVEEQAAKIKEYEEKFGTIVLPKAEKPAKRKKKEPINET